jgi:hypothetical protein
MSSWGKYRGFKEEEPSRKSKRIAAILIYGLLGVPALLGLAFLAVTLTGGTVQHVGEWWRGLPDYIIITPVKRERAE